MYDPARDVFASSEDGSGNQLDNETDERRSSEAGPTRSSPTNQPTTQSQGLTGEAITAEVFDHCDLTLTLSNFITRGNLKANLQSLIYKQITSKTRCCGRLELQQILPQISEKPFHQL